MKKISEVGSLLKKIYRVYSQALLRDLQEKGFLDLRPSFLEILIYLCEYEASSIKEIGEACGLKKQTMTSHLNELEKRGYIIRRPGQKDKRELQVHLTAYGEKFKFALIEVISILEQDYTETLGEVEFDRVLMTLENFYTKIESKNESQQILDI